MKEKFKVGDRVVFNGRNASVTHDEAASGNVYIILDRTSTDKGAARYVDPDDLALIPNASNESEEDDYPTYNEGLLAAADFAANARPDLITRGVSKSADAWISDFRNWINDLSQHQYGHNATIGSGGFEIRRTAYDDEPETCEIYQHVVSLFPEDDSAYVWMRN